MTEGESKARTDSGESKPRWLEEMQEALDRTGDAIRTAWEATRESRMTALESAKQAAQELGEVIEKGITAAKERWAEQTGAEAEGGADVFAPTQPTTDTTPETPAQTEDVTVTPVVDESAKKEDTAEAEQG